jgi:hypothetical protein
VGGRLAADENGSYGPGEWDFDIAQVLCEGSAVIRLGAAIVATDDQVWIPGSIPTAGFRPGVAAPVASPPAQLRPGGDVLEAMVAVPDALAARVGEQPELGDVVKVDLGDELSRKADRAFLIDLPDVGPAAAPVPRAIGRRPGIQVATAADLLKTLRDIVDTVFAAVPRPAFRNPGWVLHPEVLSRVGRIRTANGQTESGAAGALSLADFGLFRQVSASDGMLLGFPFTTSSEATDGTIPPPPTSLRIFFGADWQEAFIAVGMSLVTVDVPGEPSVPNATVIRASMAVDFALRRESAFAWADPPP